MSEELQSEFSKHNVKTIKEFVISFLPMPEAKKYKFYKIKTSDDIQYNVWGEDDKQILQQFKRFLALRIYT